MIAVTSQSFLKSPYLMSRLKSYVGEDQLILAPVGEILSGDELYNFLKTARAVLCGREILDRELLLKLPNLRFISKYGVGLDNIDQGFVAESGRELFFKEGVNAAYVAEQTLGFMIGSIRRLVPAMEALRDGVWVKNGGRSLFGKTIGIVGFGHVGKSLADLLQPFSPEILVNDIVDIQKHCNNRDYKQVDLDYLLKNADIVTMHVPLSDETRHMISASEFSLMKESAILINTCRGSVVDEDDLIEALLNDKIAFACSDVFETEPLNKAELYKLNNFWPTPHIAGNAEEAVIKMGLAAIDGIKKYLGDTKHDS